jgi:hypothetical protein
MLLEWKQISKNISIAIVNITLVSLWMFEQNGLQSLKELKQSQ